MRQHVKHYHIGEELRLGCGERLFDFLAECVSDFVRIQNLHGKKLPLGKDYFIVCRSSPMALAMTVILFFLQCNHNV